MAVIVSEPGGVVDVWQEPVPSTSAAVQTMFPRC